MPLKIGGLQLNKLTWDNFKGKIPEDSPYRAHIYWRVGYNYLPKFVTNPKSRKIEYNINISTWVQVQEKSWHRVEIPHLLNHE